MVTFVANDREEVFSASCAQSFAYDGLLDLHKGVYNRVVRDFNHGEPLSLKISTHSDAPAGSGLGFIIYHGRCHTDGLCRIAAPAVG